MKQTKPPPPPTPFLSITIIIIIITIAIPVGFVRWHLVSWREMLWRWLLLVSPADVSRTQTGLADMWLLLALVLGQHEEGLVTCHYLLLYLTEKYYWFVTTSWFCSCFFVRIWLFISEKSTLMLIRCRCSKGFLRISPSTSWKRYLFSVSCKLLIS